MRILVTGGAGFIGSHIVDRSISRGDEVLVIDDLSTGNRENINGEAKLEKINILDGAVTHVVDTFKPHVITHCAAQASVPRSISDPTLDAKTNIVGGLNLAQAASTSGCTKFIYVTTGGALYGPPQYLPCDEKHPINPQSPYGLSKWTLERYLQMILPTSIQLQNLRLSNVYGARQDPNGEAGVVAIFASRMLRGEKIEIFGNGEQTRDFLYAPDVADAYERALSTTGPMTLNISTGIATTINNLFSLMAQLTSYDSPPIYAKPRPGEIKHVVLANSKAQNLLNWWPAVSLKEGVTETINWFRHQSHI